MISYSTCEVERGDTCVKFLFCVKSCVCLALLWVSLVGCIGGPFYVHVLALDLSCFCSASLLCFGMIHFDLDILFLF